MSCVQTLITEQDCLYMDFLSNCVGDRLYPPLRMYENANFVIIDGDDNKQASISKVGFEVYINGDYYTDKDAAMTQLAAEIKCINESRTGGGSGAKSDLEKLKTEANDLIQTISYLDAGDPINRRVDTIVYSSAALGLSATETFAYGGSSGDYYVTSITLS